MEEPTARLRVLIADDHAPMRIALRRDLEEGGIDVCAEAGTGSQAVDAALSARPDLCLIDIHMPDGGGIAAAKTIRQALPRIKVILITANPDEEGAIAAARAGAHGYLNKDVDPRKLPQIVMAVVAGQASYPRRLVRGLLREVRQAMLECLGT
jgi:two-component system, NarL family, nitrate/nitrite response regulator NarL